MTAETIGRPTSRYVTLDGGGDGDDDGDDGDEWRVAVDWHRTALLIIDMQVDFLYPGGFGAALGNDVARLQSAVAPCQRLLAAVRAYNDAATQTGKEPHDPDHRPGILVVHTREGHRPDLSDLHPVKQRYNSDTGEGVIGAPGPHGRVLVRGEPGHDIVPELYPRDGEPIVDKPGKGAFYATDLDCLLRAHNNVKTLLVCGVTTEVCVHTTVREANDRGYQCLVVADATASYHTEFHTAALRMIRAQNGIFGRVVTADPVRRAVDASTVALTAAAATGT